MTQAEWAARGLGAPSHFVGADLPVETVTWLQAVAWCNAQSLAESLTPAYAIDGNQVTWNRGADGWRLPTEAEWEWLGRAGTHDGFRGRRPDRARVQRRPGPGAGGLVLRQLRRRRGRRARATGGLKLANPWGAHDMAGNVSEWCWDWYGDYRLLDADGDGVVLDPAGPATGTRARGARRQLVRRQRGLPRRRARRTLPRLGGRHGRPARGAHGGRGLNLTDPDRRGSRPQDGTMANARTALHLSSTSSAA